MRIQTLIKELKFDLNAVRARVHSSRRRVEKARARLDAALSLEDDPPHYLLAFDAKLMAQESRHEEARDRYRECLAVLPEVLSLEETYVSLYCRLGLGVYDNNCFYEELEELRENAANLGVRGSPKYFLPIVSKSLLLEVCGHRIPLDQTFKVKNGPAKPSRAYYRAKFKVL